MCYGKLGSHRDGKERFLMIGDRGTYGSHIVGGFHKNIESTIDQAVEGSQESLGGRAKHERDKEPENLRAESQKS